MNEDTRILSREESISVVQRLVGYVRGTGTVNIDLSTWWNGELRWARNGLTAVSDRRDMMILVSRRIGGGYGQAATNQLDDVSLEAVIRSAEQQASGGGEVTYGDFVPESPRMTTPSPTIWSDATMTATTEARSTLAKRLIDGAEAKGMLSAGYLEIRGASGAGVDTDDRTLQQWKALPAAALRTALQETMTFAAYTQAQCSMTVRHPKGTGSGWAGESGFDWAQINASALADRALEKCLQSLNPVRIEPGRYTVVLEPQAVADMVNVLMVQQPGYPLIRRNTELGQGPFALDYDRTLQLWRTRLGLRVIDERITIDHDPMDAQTGVLPKAGLAPITWIDKGVLKTLAYNRDYAVVDLNENLPALDRPGYRMSGGTTTVNEMIETTKRGLLVTRLSNLRVLDTSSLLVTGVTRDGLWLIENGKISKAVKNMRITESPLFVLNNVEQLGVPVPVFRPVQDSFSIELSPAIVPPLKILDFSFIATTDAV